MKSRYLAIPIISFLLIFHSAGRVTAQEPPHPPTIGHGQKGNQAPGATAPIDGGTSILLLMAVGYGSYVARKSRKSD